MTMPITFNDINISKWLDGILLVTRNVGQNRVPQLDQVGRSDGKMFSYIRADEGTITVTAIVRTDVNKKRRLLADALTTSTPAKLIFADEPDIYYNAISTGQITLDEAYLHNTLTITFTVPDGIAHSVATKTFDNMPYKDTSNLLLEDPVGTQVATGDDWLITTIGHFNGKPGKQYTASVNLEQLDNTVSFQAWTGDANGVRQNLISTVAFSATGKATITFIAPENIDYSTILLQLACFNGNASGSYSWSETKVELGDKATPYKDVPVNLVTGSGGTFTGWSGYTSIASWFVDTMAFAPNASSAVLAAQSFTDNSSSTVYTFSFLAKADTAGDKAHCELFGSVGASDFTLTTSWQAFTAKLTYTTARRVYVGATKGNKGSIYIAQPKLE